MSFPPDIHWFFFSILSTKVRLQASLFRQTSSRAICHGRQRLHCRRPRSRDCRRRRGHVFVPPPLSAAIWEMLPNADWLHWEEPELFYFYSLFSILIFFPFGCATRVGHDVHLAVWRFTRCPCLHLQASRQCALTFPAAASVKWGRKNISTVSEMFQMTFRLFVHCTCSHKTVTWDMQEEKNKQRKKYFPPLKVHAKQVKEVSCRKMDWIFSEILHCEERTKFFNRSRISASLQK